MVRKRIYDVCVILLIIVFVFPAFFVFIYPNLINILYLANVFLTKPITWIGIIAYGVNGWYEYKRKEKERVRRVIEQRELSKEAQIKRLRVQISIKDSYTEISIGRNLKLMGIILFIKKSMCSKCYEEIGEYLKNIDDLKIPKEINESIN